jgi:hypothetical protein
MVRTSSNTATNQNASAFFFCAELYAKKDLYPDEKKGDATGVEHGGLGKSIFPRLIKRLGKGKKKRDIPYGVHNAENSKKDLNKGKHLFISQSNTHTS